MSTPGSDEVPTTFYKKGGVLEKSVQDNKQLELPGLEREVVETWVLLVYTEERIDKENRLKIVRVRWVLALPNEWNEHRPIGYRELEPLPEFEIELQLKDENRALTVIEPAEAADAPDAPDFMSEEDLDVPLLRTTGSDTSDRHGAPITTGEDEQNDPSKQGDSLVEIKDTSPEHDLDDDVERKKEE